MVSVGLGFDSCNIPVNTPAGEGFRSSLNQSAVALLLVPQPINVATIAINNNL